MVMRKKVGPTEKDRLRKSTFDFLEILHDISQLVPSNEHKVRTITCVSIFHIGEYSVKPLSFF